MFRPNYDFIGVIVWFYAVFAILIGRPPYWQIWVLLALAMLVHRAFASAMLLRFRLSISSFRVAKLNLKQILKNSQECLEKDSLWLGDGFRWTQKHAEIAAHIMSRNPEEMKTLPEWLPKAVSTPIVKYLGPPHSVLVDEIGVPWIHGINPEESQIPLPLKSLPGHTLILGTTRAGKTRLYELVCTEVIHMGKVMVIIDPKGDKDWENRLRKECENTGRKFLYFHPAHPSKSIRLNPLANWSTVSSVATRISQLVDADGSFAAFAWKTLSRVMRALVAEGEKPTIRMVKQYTQAGIEELLTSLLKKFFLARLGANWDAELNAFKPTDAANQRGGKSTSNSKDPKTDWMIAKFRKEFLGEKETGSDFEIIDTIGSLISMHEHSREHFSKMIQVLEPILEMLGTGEVGAMLSPDPTDLHDKREIYTTKQVIEEGAVLYVGTDSLADKTIGAAIGSIILADFASVAGDMYNCGFQKDIYLFADEAAEVINDQLIQLLNKGGGAGFKIFLATQTEADLITKLGSQEKARQAIGNMNNVICLRLKDFTTAKWIAESFGKTMIRHQEESHSSASDSSASATDFKGTVSRSLKTTEVPLVSPDLLTRLPPLQYYAFLAGGMLYKGRLPLIL